MCCLSVSSPRSALECPVQELEAAAAKQDGHAADLQASASTAQARNDAAVAALQERLTVAEAGAARLQTEV